MIDKKTDIYTPELNLFPIYGKNIELSFSGDRISSNGGLLLLRELYSKPVSFVLSLNGLYTYTYLAKTGIKRE